MSVSQHKQGLVLAFLAVFFDREQGLFMRMPEDREDRAVGNMIKGIVPPVTICHPGGIGRQNNGQLSTAEIKGFGLLSGYAGVRHANNRLTLVFSGQLPLET